MDLRDVLQKKRSRKDRADLLRYEPGRSQFPNFLISLQRKSKRVGVGLEIPDKNRFQRAEIGVRQTNGLKLSLFHFDRAIKRWQPVQKRRRPTWWFVSRPPLPDELVNS
jgi:hypothetical protein